MNFNTNFTRNVISAVLVLFFQIHGISDLNAQQKKLYSISENNLVEERYSEAYSGFKKLLSFYPTNAHYNFKAGLACFKIPELQDSAIFFFKNADTAVISGFKNKYKETAAPPETWYYMAQWYQNRYYYDEAMAYYRKFSEIAGEDTEYLRTERKLQECEFGKKSIMETKDIYVYDLGENVNTVCNEHSPIVNNTENKLFFTTKIVVRQAHSESETQYNEDIYVTEKVNGRWTAPTAIGTEINTQGHEASAGISSDGNRLYLYKDTNKGDIYISELQNNTWTTPKPLEGNINTKYRETHICVSRDEKFLFFSSDRPGGYGGSDIYLSERNEKGKWAEPKNLGKTINTEYNEEGAFWSESQQTLFFSSDGHLGMGGYDLFKSVKKENQWSEPENLGFPTNSPGDDIFYFTSEKHPDVAYYVSNHHGTAGSTNLYSIVSEEEFLRIRDKIEGEITYPSAQALPVSVTVFVYRTPEISPKDETYIRKSLATYGVDTTKVTLIPVLTNFNDDNLLRTRIKCSKDPKIITPASNDEFAANTANGSYIILKPTFEPTELLASVDNSVREMKQQTPTEIATADVSTRRKKRINSFIKFEKTSVVKQEIQKQNIVAETDNSEILPEEVVINKNTNEPTIVSKAEGFTIYFDYNLAVTHIPAQINSVIEELKSTSKLIEIYGHTDSKGQNSYNYDLAFARITFVENYLIQHGISSDRIVAKSFGEELPAAPNELNGTDYAEGRKQNRRVELRLK